MDSCNKHGDVRCRFFCNTCSIPVCHLCMESGDHVIPQHQCIPLGQHFENEIGTVLDKTTQHKTKYDQIRLKWDTHLSSLEGVFGKLKNDIRQSKQQLLQQMDLAEQSLMKTASIAKARKETSIKCAKVSHEQNFTGIYQQLNGKCQFILQKLANNNFVDNEAFQECHNLLSKLQKELNHFDEEELLEIHFTFVPSKTCTLGELIAPKDADKILGPDVESSIKAETGTHAQKRMKIDTGVGVPAKQEEGDSKITSNCVKRPNNVSIVNAAKTKVNQSSYNVNVAGTSTINVNKRIHDASHVNKASTSTPDATCNSSTNTNCQSSGMPRQVKSPFSVLEKNGKSRPAISSLCVDNKSVARVINSQGNIVVDLRCAGIVWADNDSLLEVSTNKRSIKIKHHKISDRSQLGPDSTIHCEQNMEDVELHVCPKFHSPDCSFVVAFKHQIAIISRKGLVGEVTWKRIPTSYAILAISWRKHPSQFVAIVKGSDHKVSIMRDISDSSAKSEWEVRTLPDVDFYHYHPFDISSHHEFGICDTLSGSVLFFSGLGVKRLMIQVIAPSFLINGQALSVLVKDDEREWFILWKGRSSSDGQLKWAIARYNSSFVFLSTVIQFPYKEQLEEPKAFCGLGNNLAVLHNSLEIIFHKNFSTLS